MKLTSRAVTSTFDLTDDNPTFTPYGYPATAHHVRVTKGGGAWIAEVIFRPASFLHLLDQVTYDQNSADAPAFVRIAVTQADA